MGEHYSCTTEQIASPLIFFASLINQTKNIKFATGVIGLPQHHPVIVANEVAMFDHMAQGRFVFGIGPGGLASDLEVFDHEDHAVRNEMVAEHLRIVLEIWKSDPPYDIQGKYWNVQIKNAIYPELGIGSMSKPYQLPHPPIHISSMSPDSPTVALAARKAGFRSPRTSPRTRPSMATGNSMSRAARPSAASRPERTGPSRATSSSAKATPRPRTG